MGDFESIVAGDQQVRLYLAGEASRHAGGVALYHPWWGLNDDVLAYADRLASAGFVVAAPDMFDGEVASTIEAAEKLARAADEATINAIAAATLARLGSRDGGQARIAALGFSFGAHWAMWSPIDRNQVVASVLYYGTTGDGLTQADTPVLGHFAEHDPYEDAAWVAEFEQTLRSAGRDVTIHRYPGVGHWFAEPSKDAYRAEAAELAFERTVTFLRERLQAA